MTPGARRRRSATRRKLGRTRAARTAARDARKPPPRTYVRGRDVRMVMRIGGEEVTLENAGARVENASAFYGIDRSVEPERLSGWSIGFTAHETGDGPLHFTTDHSSPWDSLWSAISAAGAIPVHPRNLDALREEMAAYPREPHDDRIDALAYAMQMSGVQPLPPRQAMSQMIDRIAAPLSVETMTRAARMMLGEQATRDAMATIRRELGEAYRTNRIDDPDQRSLFARCGSLRRVLNDELTTPDGFPFTAPQ